MVFITNTYYDSKMSTSLLLFNVNEKTNVQQIAWPLVQFRPSFN